MVFLMGGRGCGKSITAFRNWCERASELELQIEFAKKFGLDYTHTQTELDKIYQLLDGGRNETSSKEHKNKKRRLF